MKNRIFFILTIIALLAAPASTYAGFLVKKHAATQTAAATGAKQDASSFLKTSRQEKVAEILEVMTTPQSGFQRMLLRGQVSTIALICGVIGFFVPILAVIALVFGFLGFSSKNARRKGVGVAAFVLGLAAIVMVAFGGLAPISIF